MQARSIFIGRACLRAGWSLLTPTFHCSDWLTGGNLGPEASLLVFPVIVAMFVAFHLLHPATAKT